jgi:thiosulfate/3-mercaptopyruvate sulfurtransferase
MTEPILMLPTPLVTIHWVNAHLHHPQLVLIDCRFALDNPQQGRQLYEQRHLPGAFYLDLNADLSSPMHVHGGRHPLPEVPTLVRKLEAIGISSEPTTAVVLYDSTKNAFAARLWWLLRYLGHESVAVLDGGFSAWEDAQFPLATQLPTVPKQGKFVPHVQTDWVASRADVLRGQAMDEVHLVDARSPERYRGEQEPIDPIAGSIPGAVNLFWQTNLDENGQFKSPTALEKVWSTVPSSTQDIFYCGSGVTACVNLLAQAVMNKPLPKLYVGGWSDWCTYETAHAEPQ